MMTLTTGGELRHLGLLGIQIGGGAVDRFIIEVFPPPSLLPLTCAIHFFFYKTSRVEV